MKTTINLPEKPLQELMASHPEMTKTTLVAVALERMSLEEQWEKIKALRGKVKIRKGFNLTRLRDRKHLRPLRYAA